MLQRHGDGADSLEVFRHVLAHKAISARCTADELSVHVFQRNGKSVDLRLDGILGIRLLLTQVRIKFAQLIIGKDVLQALQRYCVTDFNELAQRLTANAARWADRRSILGILPLQFLQFSQHMVIIVVRNFRVIQNVILVIMIFQLSGQALYFQFCVSCIHGISCLSCVKSVAPI